MATKTHPQPSEEDREFLDPLENASELYDRYLKLSRMTDLTPDEPEPYSPAPPPLDLGFRDTPAGIVFNKTKKGPLTYQL